MLAVSNGAAAIAFYKEAFGAEELWRIDAGGSIVAGLSVNGADFFWLISRLRMGLGVQTWWEPRRSGSNCSSMMRRLWLLGLSLQARRNLIPLWNTTIRWSARPINRMLQGAVRDPFGHMWLIGHILS
jgi:PhnB protein